jgi:hypothetical protein
MDLLTDVTAAIYVAKLFASYGAEYDGMSITNVAASPACDEGLDVAFTYGAGLAGVMTVWVEADGKLYGEW